MNEVENTEIFIVYNVNRFLSGKPIWVWWAVYIMMAAIISIIIFSAFYVLTYILKVRWWAGVVFITIAAGFVWGTIAYNQ